MGVQEKLYTSEEFWEIAQRRDNDAKRLELINGIIIELPPSSPTNGMIAMLIGHLLLTHVLPTGSGYVTGPDVGYQLGPNTICQPDAAYISKQRAGGIPRKVFPIAPDLAVEIISPSETVRSVLDKVRLYLQAGA
jgi:Uma2 family endonuclease